MLAPFHDKVNTGERPILTAMQESLSILSAVIGENCNCRADAFNEHADPSS